MNVILSLDMSVQHVQKPRGVKKAILYQQDQLLSVVRLRQCKTCSS